MSSVMFASKPSLNASLLKDRKDWLQTSRCAKGWCSIVYRLVPRRMDPCVLVAWAATLRLRLSEARNNANIARLFCLVHDKIVRSQITHLVGTWREHTWEEATEVAVDVAQRGASAVHRMQHLVVRWMDSTVRSMMTAWRTSSRECDETRKQLEKTRAHFVRSTRRWFRKVERQMGTRLVRSWHAAVKARQITLAQRTRDTEVARVQWLDSMACVQSKMLGDAADAVKTTALRQLGRYMLSVTRADAGRCVGQWRASVRGLQVLRARLLAEGRAGELACALKEALRLSSELDTLRASTSLQHEALRGRAEEAEEAQEELQASLQGVQEELGRCRAQLVKGLEQEPPQVGRGGTGSPEWESRKAKAEQELVRVRQESMERSPQRVRGGFMSTMARPCSVLGGELNTNACKREQPQGGPTRVADTVQAWTTPTKPSPAAAFLTPSTGARCQQRRISIDSDWSLHADSE